MEKSLFYSSNSIFLVKGHLDVVSFCYVPGLEKNWTTWDKKRYFNHLNLILLISHADNSSTTVPSPNWSPVDLLDLKSEEPHMELELKITSSMKRELIANNTGNVKFKLIAQMRCLFLCTREGIEDHRKDPSFWQVRGNWVMDLLRVERNRYLRAMWVDVDLSVYSFVLPTLNMECKICRHTWQFSKKIARILSTSTTCQSWSRVWEGIVWMNGYLHTTPQWALTYPPPPKVCGV